MRWRFIGAYTLKGAITAVRVEGVDVYSHIDEWKPSGMVIGLADPLYPNQRQRLEVWRLMADGRNVYFAAAEFTNGVWGTFIQDFSDVRPPVTALQCEHLADFEQEVLSRGLSPTFAGQAWSEAGYWVYFGCLFDFAAIRKRRAFADCVIDRGTHDGQEAGFLCTECATGVMGRHPHAAQGQPVYR